MVPRVVAGTGAEARGVAGARDPLDELAEQIAFAVENLRANPAAPFPATAKPSLRDRVFFAPNPLGPQAKVAFVFPGSGNQFDGMGRDLSAQWPEVLRRQQSENELLRSQFAPQSVLGWQSPTMPRRAT